MTFPRFCIAALVTLPSCLGLSGEGEPASSPRVLFERLLVASKAHDYESVRPLVYPWRPYEGMDAPGANVMAWECVVELMKNPRPGYAGDWAYSDEALSALLRTPLDFQVAREGPAESITRSVSPEDLFALDLGKGCRVCVLRTGGGWKLVFWEGLTRLVE